MLVNKFENIADCKVSSDFQETFPSKQHQANSSYYISSQSEVKTFRLSINRGFVNKDLAEGSSHAHGWAGADVSVLGLRHHVEMGHCINAAYIRNGYRADSNFGGSQLLIFDIDNTRRLDDNEKYYHHQLTIEEALALPIIRDYCAYIYPSPSHTDSWHRFRAIFVLPEVVNNPSTYRQLIRQIGEQIPGADPAAMSATNLFYGHTGCNPILWNPSAIAPVEWIRTAESAASPTVQEFKSAAQKEKGKPKDRQALEWLWAIDPNAEDINWNAYRSILMGAHHSGLDRDDVFRWSQQSRIHQDKEFSKIWENISGKGSIGPDGKRHFATRGKLHYHAKNHGWTPQPGIPKTMKRWQDSWKLTPTHVLNVKYLSFEDIWEIVGAAVKKAWTGAPVCLFLRSPLGSGKTGVVSDLLNHLSAASILNLPNQNALSRDSVQRFSQTPEGELLDEAWRIFTHLQDITGIDEKSELAQGLTNRLSCVLDSLHHFRREDGTYASREVYVLDEFVSTKANLTLGSTLKEKAPEYYEHLRGVLSGGKLFIAPDGNASDRDIDFFTTLLREAGVKPNVFVIENQHPGTTVTYDLVSARVQDEESGEWKISPQKGKALLEDQIIEAVGRARGSDWLVPIASASAEFVRTMHEKLASLGYKGVAIHADNSSNSEIKNIIKNLNQIIDLNRKLNGFLDVDYIIFSPSCCAGVNWNTEYTSDTGFAYLCLESIDIRGCLQITRRFRNVEIWKTHIHTGVFSADDAEGSAWRSSSQDRIQAMTLAYAMEELATSYKNACLHSDETLRRIARLMGQIQQELEGKQDAAAAFQGAQFFRISAEDKALRNFEQKNMNECFVWAAINAGHTVVDKPTTLEGDDLANTKQAIQERKEQRAAMEKEAAKGLAELCKAKCGELASVVEPQKILNEELKAQKDRDDFDTVDKKDRYKAGKALNVCPVLLNEPDLITPENIRPLVKDDNFRLKIEKLWFLHHPDALRIKTADYWGKIAGGDINLAGIGIRSDGLYLQTLLDLGILDLVMGFSHEYDEDDPTLRELNKTLNRSKKRQVGLKGRKPGRQSPIRFWKEMLVSIGIVAINHQQGKGTGRKSRYSFHFPWDPELEGYGPCPKIAQSVFYNIHEKHRGLLERADQDAEKLRELLSLGEAETIDQARVRLAEEIEAETTPVSSIATYPEVTPDGDDEYLCNFTSRVTPYKQLGRDILSCQNSDDFLRLTAIYDQWDVILDDQGELALNEYSKPIRPLRQKWWDAQGEELKGRLKAMMRIELPSESKTKKPKPPLAVGHRHHRGSSKGQIALIE